MTTSYVYLPKVYCKNKGIKWYDDDKFIKSKGEQTMQKITLGNDVRFAEDTLQMFIDITNMSDDLNAKINNEIAEDKLYYIYYMSDKLNGRDWSEAGVYITSTTLTVTIFNDKHLDCCIDVCYEDKVDQMLWSNVSLKIDLAEHEDYLKNLILRAFINRLF